MKFRSKEIDLSKDLNLIVGPNGSGKSSVLEALAISFQMKERGSSFGKYIRKGTKSAKIVLECDWMGSSLTIETELLKGSKKRKVKYQGKEYKDAEANTFLSTHFEKQHNEVTFALQGEDKFVTSSKTKNLQNLVDLLQMDFNKEIENVKGIIKETNNKKETIIRDLNGVRGSIQTSKDSITSFEKVLENSQNSLNNMGPAPVGNVEEIDKEIVDIRMKISSLDENIQKNEKTRKDLEYVSSEISKTKFNLENKKNEISKLNSAGEIIDYSEKENSLKEFQNNLQLKNIQLRENISKISGLTTQINSENQRMSLFKNGYCPTCTQKLEDNVKVSFDNSLATLEQSKKEADNLSAEINESIKGLNESISETQKEIEAIKLRNAEISHNAQMRSMLENSIKELESNLTALEGKEKELKEIPMLPTDEAAKIELTNSLKELENKKLSFQTWRDNKIKYENEISQHKQYIDTFKNNLVSYEQQEKDLSQKLLETEAEISKWVRVQEIFVTVPKVHLKNVVDDIKAICDKIVHDFGYKELKMELDEKGLEYLLCGWPLDDVDDADITYEMCSTFEKNLVNLSLIYALANMFKVPLVCVDELDANSDDANTKKLGKLILRLTESVNAIAVSHDPNLMVDLLQNSRSISILKMEENNERSDV